MAHKTLWGDKTTEELIEAYDFLGYFYNWIDVYLKRHIDDNPEVRIYKNQPIKQRCMEVYEKQYEQYKSRKVPPNYKKEFE